MNEQNQTFCFCSLALGERYREHALLLAQDIAEYSPRTFLVILSDKPQEFSKYPHILAFKHQQQSIGCYHDQRFVIAKALSLFETCVFLDADIRILDKVSPNIKWLPGITARSCASVIQHNHVYLNSVQGVSRTKRMRD